MVTGNDHDRRRTLWLALLCGLMVLAIAQLDEYRRYRRAREAYIKQLTARTAQSAAYLDQLNEFLSKPPDARGAMPMPPPQVAQRTPPEPPRARYMLVARVRQGVCFGAFAVAAAMPFVWLMSSEAFRGRHRRLIAEAMLALALLGTIGMLLGPGYLANWDNFRIGTDAAGYGLVLVPLGIVAVVLAARPDPAASPAGDVGDAAGGGGGSNT
jgi:MFS family permease